MADNMSLEREFRGLIKSMANAGVPLKSEIAMLETFSIAIKKGFTLERKSAHDLAGITIIANGISRSAKQK